MKHSHSRSADFWRTFTLSLAAAGLLFGLGWLLISHNGPQEGPLPYTLPLSLAEDAPGSRILFPAGRYYLDGEALADLITLPLPTDPARQSDRSAELIKALVRRHLPAVLSESGEELVTQLLTHSHSDLTLLDYLERRTALGTLARREEIPVYCVYLDGTSGQAGYYLSEVSLTCLRAAFPAE